MGMSGLCDWRDITNSTLKKNAPQTNKMVCWSYLMCGSGSAGLPSPSPAGFVIFEVGRGSQSQLVCTALEVGFSQPVERPSRSRCCEAAVLGRPGDPGSCHTQDAPQFISPPIPWLSGDSWLRASTSALKVSGQRCG